MPKAKTTKPTRNLESEVMTSLSSVINYIKTHVNTRLVEAANSEKVQLDPNQLRQVTSIIPGLIDEAFFRSSSEVMSVLKEE